MILVFVLEPAVRQSIVDQLQREGYPLHAAPTTAAALAECEKEPELIITGDLQLLKEYNQQHPHRLTPFLYIASPPDPKHVVQGLDMGADDVLVPPLNMEVLGAKVRAVFRRKTRYSAPSFYGNLARIPFPILLRFCWKRAVTGEIVVSSQLRHARVLLKGGLPQAPDAGDVAEFIGDLYGINDGTFVLHSQPLEFKEIEDAAMPITVPPPGRERPAGRLSAIKLDQQRQFQVQTELSSNPRDRIVTIVTLIGKIVLKRETLPPGDAMKHEIEKLIEAQHRSVEDEVRQRVNPDVVKRIKEREGTSDRGSRLYEAGCQRFKERNFQTALRNWEEALLIDPDDRLIRINLDIVRKRLGVKAPEYR